MLYKDKQTLTQPLDHWSTTTLHLHFTDMETLPWRGCMRENLEMDSPQEMGGWEMVDGG